MSTTEHVTIDLELVDRLSKEETAALDVKHARSLSYRRGGQRTSRAACPRAGRPGRRTRST